MKDQPNEELPPHYKSIRNRFGDYGKILAELGQVVRDSGPLDNKTSELIQLAAAATLRSEGAVHSHAKRAMDLGASPEEVYHTLILLTSTIGFPNVAASISWVDDLFE
ncbi:MAG: Carboxymuconolactone decarboxylase family protein [Methanobacterium sp. PtaU1.Bin242]|nr:MAG: Carboxymuconolactone decarboxylase family protein [Methanobacterium sp. PtaU1.Bin242]